MRAQRGVRPIRDVKVLTALLAAHCHKASNPNLRKGVLINTGAVLSANQQQFHSDGRRNQ